MEKKIDLRNEVSGVRTEDIDKCMNITTQLYDAIKGNKSFEEAWNDELFRSVYRLMRESTVRSADHGVKTFAYDKMNMGQLLGKLFDRLSMFYNCGYADGAELPGIAWSMESNGIFAITLKDCAVNMEHSVEIPSEDSAYIHDRGMVFNVWLDVPDMEDDDPSDAEGRAYGNGYKYVGFTAQFGYGDKAQYKDVTFEPTDSIDNHKKLVIDILADFDMIDEMLKEAAA